MAFKDNNLQAGQRQARICGDPVLELARVSGAQSGHTTTRPAGNRPGV